MGNIPANVSWLLTAVVTFLIVFALISFIKKRWLKRWQPRQPAKGMPWEQAVGRTQRAGQAFDYDAMLEHVRRGGDLTAAEAHAFMQERISRYGFTVDQEKLNRLADSLPGATDRQVDLYAGTVYTAETRGETVDRQIREQMLYGGDTPVDFPDGKGGRVLVLNGEVHQLDWCEPPPEDEAA